MKKIGNIIMIVIVAFFWGFFFYTFHHAGTFSNILCLIILLPFTFKVVYSILIERIQNSAQEDELAKNFTPFSAAAPSLNTSDARYCTACGAKNGVANKFCCVCGKPLN